MKQNCVTGKPEQWRDCKVAETAFDDARAMLKMRDPEGHKGTFGHGLLIAGQRGMAGAAILSARAALRSGMGKLTVQTDDFNLPILQVAVPEAVIAHSPRGEFQAIAIGPGLGQSDEARSLLTDVLRTQPQRLVVDADGLNLLAQMENRLSLLPRNAVLTPHPMEWQRLTAHDPDADPRDYAQRNSLYIILKGHATHVFTPQGNIFANTTGNSGMATAGSGDVLTGILLSLLAQGYSHEVACRLGVWLHGKAGDIAAAQLSEEAMIASDIVEHLPAAFRTLRIV